MKFVVQGMSPVAPLAGVIPVSSRDLPLLQLMLKFPEIRSPTPTPYPNESTGVWSNEENGVHRDETRYGDEVTPVYGVMGRDESECSQGKLVGGGLPRPGPVSCR